jgi:hypothetical protein
VRSRGGSGVSSVVLDGVAWLGHDVVAPGRARMDASLAWLHKGGGSG